MYVGCGSKIFKRFIVSVIFFNCYESLLHIVLVEYIIALYGRISVSNPLVMHGSAVGIIFDAFRPCPVREIEMVILFIGRSTPVFGNNKVAVIKNLPY